ncbi:MAG: D-alanyl-D-alanine carboxypeptidase/D-alanyl-D-alanine-endopeptidase [Myxococcales bacterium FL481]|nr:MAG: D-alanyl-D-alanine carboxypeptidase/D-alanyl-D-alanine-endopeptidase [Myxococcales bacterium FL481]
MFRDLLARAHFVVSIGLLACSPLADSPAAASPVENSPAPHPASSDAAATAPARPLPSDQHVALRAQVDELLTADFLTEANVGVSLIALPSREVVYQRHADAPLNPASNVKLLTSAAALALLGPEHRYTTEVLAARDSVRDGIVRGDIYLKGSGDPQLVTSDMYSIARAIRNQGIRAIRGRIVTDSSRFDADGLPPGFDQKDEFASYRAPIGATSVNFNTAVIVMHPAATPNAPIAVTVDPAVPSIEVTNSAHTVAGRRNRLSVAAEHRDGQLAVTVAGSLGVDASPRRVRYPIADPSRYSAEVLAMALRDVGVQVPRRPVRAGRAPTDAQTLAQHRGRTVAEHLRAINKRSNNFMAEQLLRTFVPEDGATAAASLRAMRDYLRGVGLTAQAVDIGNGSGLYDNNRVSPAAMTSLLATVAADYRYAAEFIGSLATMGVDGTTKRRLADTEHARWIRAKTGTLDGVSALSGYLGTPDGQAFAFCILFNDFPTAHRSAARELQDRIVQVVGDASRGQLETSPTR